MTMKFWWISLSRSLPCLHFSFFTGFGFNGLWRFAGPFSKVWVLFAPNLIIKWSTQTFKSWEVQFNLWSDQSCLFWWFWSVGSVSPNFTPGALSLVFHKEHFNCRNSLMKTFWEFVRILTPCYHLKNIHFFYIFYYCLIPHNSPLWQSKRNWIKTTL